jgi:large subunit ribosomal protein L29
MNIEKIRNLGPAELQQNQRDSAEQLFRLKFQMKMGQTTGLKKLRELRKDLARIKTISRERELGIDNVASAPAARPAGTQAAAPAAPAPRQAAAKKSSAKKSAAKKTKSAAPKKSAAKKKKSTAKK